MSREKEAQFLIYKPFADKLFELICILPRTKWNYKVTGKYN